MIDAVLDQNVRPFILHLPFPLDCPCTVICCLQTRVVHGQAKNCPMVLIAPQDLLNNVVYCRTKDPLFLARLN